MRPSTTALVRVTAPATLPINLAEAKAHLRVTSSGEDAYITSLIGAAVAFVDGTGELGRAMITQTWAQWVPQNPVRVRLLMGPFIALTAVQYYDAAGALQSANAADFDAHLSGDFVIVEPKDNAEWPVADDRIDAIKITYTAGFGAAADVPAGVRHALLMLIAHWYENRAAASEAAVREIPVAVAALIGNERVGWYG
jgi:uncharacterized phiE125 gp8 family phage protein